GGVQTFSVPAGISELTLEVWGAAGGNYSANGGAGGYAVGTLTDLSGISTLYVYVGGQGSGSGSSGGYNGGGNSNSYGGSGGGATDISTDYSSSWQSTTHYNSRLIVAGGGGGAGFSTTIGGYGGGTSGGQGGNGTATGGYGGGQSSPGSNNTAGLFGSASTSNSNNGGGGGGGWYGGASGVGSSTDAGGGGGSGYVNTVSSYHPSGYIHSGNHFLTNTSIIAGNSSMPNPNGGTMTGNTGNGYARISFIGSLSCVSPIQTVPIIVQSSPTVSVAASQYTACNSETVELYVSASGDVVNYQWSEGVSGTVGNYTAIPGHTTTYTLTVTNANGCTAAASTTITVDAPEVQIASNPSSALCVNAGDALALSVEHIGGGGSVNNASDYNFSVSNEPFTTISGTALTTGDDAETQTANIGFTFNYCGTDYTQVSASTNGLLRLGGGQTTYRANSMASTTYYNVIAAFWDDLSASTLYYNTSGVAPNRVFTLQHYGYYLGDGSNYFYYQIKLYETTNVIEIHYGNGLTNVTSTGGASIGINSYNNGTQSYISVTPTGSGTATTSSVSPNDAITYSQINNLTSGTKYTFRPTPPCTYAWSTGATTQQITVNPTDDATYTVTVSSPEYECDAVLSQNVTVIPTVSITATPPAICAGSASTLTAEGADTYSWDNGQTGATRTVYPSYATTYTVTGSTAAGCSATGSVTVTIPSFSAGDIGNNSETVCASHTLPITITDVTEGAGGGNVQYRWYRNGSLLANSDMAEYVISANEINGLGTTSYTYTRQFRDDCQGTWTTSTGSFTLTVNSAMNQPSVAGNRSTVCGGTTTLTASGVPGAYYRWFADAEGTQLLGQGATLTTPAVTENTTFYVQAYNPPMEGTVNFSYTGGVQTFSVPAGISELTLEVWGAAGGNYSANGGAGGYAVGTLT
ncbi:MAG: glycine-rich protein, partial [Bacteroidales bacterium]|nr:glycine-rich protein [Bacteroidales bacterium]